MKILHLFFNKKNDWVNASQLGIVDVGNNTFVDVIRLLKWTRQIYLYGVH